MGRKIARHFPPLFLISLFVLLATSAVAASRPLPITCSYEMQIWNVKEKRSVSPKKAERPYSELRPEEIDPATGCTVCSEDQELVSIPPIPPFFICYKIAPRVRSLVDELAKKGAPIHSVVGYHVIKSRGPVDKDGNRTGFSNHSFGTAIDINPEQNGLYDNCMTFGPECRLIRGGEWRIGNAGALEPDGDIVVAFKAAGFRWGGEIAGKQKDFMHFSLTGY